MESIELKSDEQDNNKQTDRYNQINDIILNTFKDGIRRIGMYICIDLF